MTLTLAFLSERLRRRPEWHGGRKRRDHHDGERARRQLRLGLHVVVRSHQESQGML